MSAHDTHDGVDAVGHFETRGVDTIPESERHSSPGKIFRMLIGAQFAFSIVLFGWLPIAFGLSFWQAVSAILVGTAVGCLVLSPMGLFGQRAGTNGAVASGAHFGVRGRLLGSLLGLFSALGFTALTVWTSGDAVVAAAHALFGLPVNGLTRGIAYAIVSAVLIAVAALGHANMMAMQRLMIPTIGIVMLIGVIALAPKMDLSYAGGEYTLGSFWATWALAAITCASVPVSYGPFASDWGRYVSSTRYSAKSMMVAYAGGSYIGLVLAYLFGALVATAFTDPTGDLVLGLAEASPAWYVVGVMLIGLGGGFAQGALGLYGMGLDFSSVFPVLKRIPATLILGGIAIVIVYLGTFVFDAVNSINAFTTILIVITTPWIAIMIVGFLYRRGFYLSDDLQVWNRRQTGGAYWFTNGVNWRPFIAWIPAVVLGLLLLNTSLYTGPLANLAGGIDLSFVVAGCSGAVIYALTLLVAPEPDAIRGHGTTAAPAIATPTTEGVS